MSEITFTLALKRYQRLIEIARDLATVTELDILLQRIVKVAEELVKAETASLLLYDQAREDLYFKTISASIEYHPTGNLSIPMDSVAGWVARHREPALLENVHQDERYYGHAEKIFNISVNSLIAVPLISRDQCVGVLEVFNKKEGVFDKEDEGILMALGAQAAVAIENARLFKQADLISVLVHELRTPLTSINTIAFLLQRPEVSEEQRRSLAKTIYEESVRLNELATSFLDLARLESGRMSFTPEVISIPQLIQETVDIIQLKAQERGIQIHIDLPPEVLPNLEADKDKIKQVLINLLTNAVKYNRDDGRIEIRAWTQDQKLFLTIRDTGLGIPEEDLPHIFEKFYRAKETEKSYIGTGLGLSICRHIIETHGGLISAQSTINVGTTFIIELPLKYSAA